jgi:hypothetical protein
MNSATDIKEELLLSDNSLQQQRNEVSVQNDSESGVEHHQSEQHVEIDHQPIVEEDIAEHLVTNNAVDTKVLFISDNIQQEQTTLALAPNDVRYWEENQDSICLHQQLTTSAQLPVIQCSTYQTPFQHNEQTNCMEAPQIVSATEQHSNVVMKKVNSSVHIPLLHPSVQPCLSNHQLQSSKLFCSLTDPLAFPPDRDKRQNWTANFQRI